MAPSIETHGASKSNTSRMLIAATTDKPVQFVSRKHDDVDLIAMCNRRDRGVREEGRIASQLAITHEGKGKTMTTLYEDPYVTCDDDGLTIHRYYFPFAGDKRVPYAAIRQAADRTMGPLTGQWRIWGMGLAPYWFHLDAKRPRKTRCIVLDVDAAIHPVLTPDNVDAVLDILRGKAQETQRH